CECEQCGEAFRADHLIEDYFFSFKNLTKNTINVIISIENKKEYFFNFLFPINNKYGKKKLLRFI
ncbi:MAG: hypothetical protein CI949_3674, partial [Halanaerobium sp.]